MSNTTENGAGNGAALYVSKAGNDADQWLVIEQDSGRTVGLSYHGREYAELFAAAPELLAALEGLLTELGDNFDIEGDAATPAIRVARAAIARAKGGG